MGTARGGRPRQPTRLKVLHGESRPSRIGRAEPVVQPGTPDPPEWFNDLHRRVWVRIVSEIRLMGILATADADVLVALVRAIVRMENAAQAVIEHGELIKGRDGNLTPPAGETTLPQEK